MSDAASEWRAVAQAFPRDAYFRAQADFYARPAEALRAFLDRAEPAIATYRQRGRVAALAAKAARAVRDLEPGPAFRFEGGVTVAPPTGPTPDAIQWAEAACNALAAELRRLQSSAAAAGKAGRHSAQARAGARQDFLARWRRVRRSCASDAEAYRVLANEEGCSPAAVKKRRQRADERSGR